MIGIPALLIGLMFVLIPSLMGWAVYRDWRSRRKRGSLALIALISIFLLIVVNRFGHNALYLYELRSMSAAQVSAVEIGGESVTDPRAVSEIVSAFNEVTWFSYNHGGTAARVPVVVRFKSGAESRYTVRYYMREEGAVFEFSRDYENGAGISYGEAFGARVPKAFEAAGLPLPKQEGEPRP